MKLLWNPYIYYVTFEHETRIEPELKDSTLHLRAYTQLPTYRAHLRVWNSWNNRDSDDIYRKIFNFNTYLRLLLASKGFIISFGKYPEYADMLNICTPLEVFKIAVTYYPQTYPRRHALPYRTSRDEIPSEVKNLLWRHLGKYGILYKVRCIPHYLLTQYLQPLKR